MQFMPFPCMPRWTLAARAAVRRTAPADYFTSLMPLCMLPMLGVLYFRGWGTLRASMAANVPLCWALLGRFLSCSIITASFFSRHDTL